ncbi:hypothetical protein BV25DRAFT_1912331 [Artomyces pyxidatus]|uniref:Uncharacterized protein n=1 Tax=Artomyces pyxidatus TaxID=48021 RepID=A0ACB8TF37_9AGAM|nr:hypothetical protein BV25DRAFT_1912331 [Artomyces pyxidatus]
MSTGQKFAASLRVLQGINGEIPYLQNLICAAFGLSEEYNRDTWLQLVINIDGILIAAQSCLIQHEVYTLEPFMEDRIPTLELVAKLEDITRDVSDNDSLFHRLFGKPNYNDAVADFKQGKEKTVELLLNTSSPIINSEPIPQSFSYISDEDSGGVHSAENGIIEGRPTRTRYLTKIREWMRDSTASSFCQLTSAAGTGKTTIAHELTVLLTKEKIPFFPVFSDRGDPITASALILAIVLGLTDSVLDLRQHMDLTLAPAAQPLLQQFTKRIISPLLICSSTVLRGKPIILIFDALDECPAELVPGLVQGIRRACLTLRSAVKIFVTSRQRRPLTELRSLSRLCLTIDVGPDFIKKRHFSKLGKLWTEEMIAYDVKVLSSLAGYFLGVTEVCNCLDSQIWPPEIISAIAKGTAAFHEEGLDKLYLAALRNALPQDAEDWAMYRDVVGTILCATYTAPVSLCTISCLLNVPIPAISRLVLDLECVLNINDDISISSLGILGAHWQGVGSDLGTNSGPKDVRVSVIHPSFRNFITNVNRCTDPTFFTDADSAKRNTSQACTTVLSTVPWRHLEICQNIFTDPIDLPSDVHELDWRAFLRENYQAVIPLAAMFILFSPVAPNASRSGALKETIRVIRILCAALDCFQATAKEELLGDSPDLHALRSAVQILLPSGQVQISYATATSPPLPF